MRHLSVFLMSLILLGCSGVAEKPVNEQVSQEQSANTKSPEEPVYTPLSEEMLYKLLLGEMAGQQGVLDVSAVQYADAAVATTDPEVAQRATQIAIYAQKWDSGLIAAKRWAELQPDNVRANQSLAAMLLVLEEKDQALVVVNKLIVMAEDSNADLYEQLRPVLLNTQVVDNALALTEELVALQSDKPEVWLLQGQVAWHAAKNQLAADSAAKALELKPGWPQAALLASRALQDLEQPKQALIEVDKALQNHPKHFQLRVQKARLLVADERSSESYQLFQQLVEERPNEAEVIYATGLLAMRQSDEDVAVEMFQKLRESKAYSGKAHYYLGVLAEKQQDTDAALAWYEKVDDESLVADALLRQMKIYGEQKRWGKINSTLATYRLNYPDQLVQSYLIEIEVLKRYRDTEEALKAANNALAVEPDDLDLRYTRGMLAVELGDLAVLENDMRRILEEDPENGHALNALGYSLADMTDRYDEAYALIRQAYELMPNDPAVIDSYGWVLYKLGRFEESLSYLRQAHELSSEDEITVHLGEVLWVMGKNEEAKAIWKKVANPEHPVLLETMERLGAR